MSDITAQIICAKNNPAELETLLISYLPFIKKQLAGFGNLSIEYDDMLSLSMLTFTGCVKQYTPEKGAFLPFCSTCIKNRLLDENRKQLGYHKNIIPFYSQAEYDELLTENVQSSLALYDKELERDSLRQEIQLFSDELNKYEISFNDLVRICPKQKRSRNQCLLLAKTVAHNKNYMNNFILHKKIPQTDLSQTFGISVKTIEKHRKYIVALIILMTDDYPGIRSFLPEYKEVN